MKRWYNKIVTSFFILSAFTIIFILSALRIQIGIENESKYNTYTIEFNYYGVDAQRIEQIITKPLESKIMSLSDILEIRSNIEFGKSITSVYFKKSKDKDSQYLSLRNIIDSLYKNLPGDVQKPIIYNSSSTSQSILTFTIYSSEQNPNQLREWADINLRKKIDAVEGVSQVMINGGGLKEILVSFDTEKSVYQGQNPQALGSIIHDSNQSISATKLKNFTAVLPVTFNSRLFSIEEIKDLPVKVDENYTKLKFLADISQTYKQPDEIVRVNGQECISISVKASSDGNLASISKDIKKILDETNLQNAEITFIIDKGKEQLELLKSALIAFIQTFILVIIILPFFNFTLKTLLLILGFIIICCLWSIGILNLFDLKLSQYTIAGFTISLGLIADPALVILEMAEISTNKDDFINKLKSQIPSLISANFTTLLVLIPLFYANNIITGIKPLCITTEIMLVCSICLSIIFLPVFIQIDNSLKSSWKVSKKIEKFYTRKAYVFTNFSIKHENKLFPIYITILVFPFVVFIINGQNLTFDENTNVIYCSSDYENELTASYINESLSPFIEEVCHKEGITFIRTETKKGAVDMEIGFNPKIISRLETIKYLSSLESYFTESFFYIPDATTTNKNKHAQIEIAVLGDNNESCRDYAKAASDYLIKSYTVDSAVLNFKRPDYEYIFIPDIIKLSNNASSVSSVASTLRYMLFGPVVDKWVQDGMEMDIRIAGKDLSKSNYNQLLNLHIPVENGFSIITGLGKVDMKQNAGKIYRKNGRHAAYITVEVNGKSSNSAVNAIKKALENTQMEKGYSYSFPREIEELNENFKILLIAFIFCISAIFILLTALTEKPLTSLLLVSTIPVSSFLPLLILFISQKPLELGDIVGLVILSGITINNSIYITESSSSTTILKVRDKIKSILITSTTTLLGSIPLYIFSKGSFSKSLAFFMLFGILNSIITCTIFFPGLFESRKKKNILSPKS